MVGPSQGRGVNFSVALDASLSSSASGSQKGSSSLKLMYSQFCIFSTMRRGRVGRPAPMRTCVEGLCLSRCSSNRVDHASVRLEGVAIGRCVVSKVGMTGGAS